ncbi:nucleotidyltransferase family protein [Paenibacillus alkalitolerans]|uniref:nucleotidyltransferase family protein n=1 Tax=Paenibacillus alkalitolerans TaxID=2799335 RepID=UPI0018F64387|nr:nucleotidyltransferase family protein [Paenibacillus alkalitolerans]
MMRSDVERILKEQKAFLKEKYYVKRIGIFGSYVRDEQSEESDIDLLVEFSKPVGFEFFDLKDYLEELLKKPIDLVTVNALKPLIRDEIMAEVQFQ